MPDDRDPFDVEDAEQIAHPVRVGGDGVVGARLVGLAVAEQVGGDDGEPLRERGLHVLHVVELSPMPWISSIAGPEPAIRNARR